MRVQKFILYFTLAFAATAQAAPNFQSKMLEGKRAKKESSQWTLSDWLTQKSRFAFWDQWLAMNRQATIYEFNIGGSHGRYEFKTIDASGAILKEEGELQHYEADFYITIFNLFAEYEKTLNSRESYGGGLGLRIFGTSSQTTNLALKAGWLKRSDLRSGEQHSNSFAEAALQLYLLNFMGLSGKYRMYFPAESNLHTKLEGTRRSAGVFVEGMIFRVFADYFQEPIQFKDASGTISKEQREGYEAGLKFYF